VFQQDIKSLLRPRPGARVQSRVRHRIHELIYGQIIFQLSRSMQAEVEFRLDKIRISLQGFAEINSGFLHLINPGQAGAYVIQQYRVIFHVLLDLAVITQRFSPMVRLAKGICPPHISLGSQTL